MNFEEKVKLAISNKCGIPILDLKLEADLERDLNISRLELDDLILTLEKEFNVEIPTETAQTFNTIGDIINFLIDNLDEFGNK
jgi:acyl carrier protein